MLVSDRCAMISETRDSVTDETVALIPVVEHFIGRLRGSASKLAKTAAFWPSIRATAAWPPGGDIATTGSLE
jgi:hypothetical protein